VAHLWHARSDGSYHFYGCSVEVKTGTIGRVKRYWETIADNLSKAGWSWGCVSALDCEGRTTWIVDAHRGDGKRFVVHAEELLTAFGELESAIRFVQLNRRQFGL
jgi:hypothetical protein